MREILQTAVIDVAQGQLVTLDEATSLRTAARHLAARRVGAAVVLRGARPVGLLSERDVTERLGAGADPDRELVSDAMSTPLLVAGWGATVGGVLQQMASEGVRHLPVLGRDGRLYGMTSLAELLALVVEAETRLDLRSVDADGSSDIFG